jgi:glycosyltransferase involved in cell wall biosynthesis
MAPLFIGDVMTDKPLKALWFSNSHQVGSGYGVQTDLFTRQMVKEGWETYIGALYGHVGQVGRANGVTILPQGFSDHGEDMLIPHYTKYKPDVYVLLYDIWVYDKDILRGVPNLTAYAPIDSRTIPPRVLDRLRACRYVWAMSKHGERLMNEAGIANAYVPHGVDCEAYKPVDRADAREKLNLPQDAFVACMVAANKGFPDRKNIRATLKAWAEFVKRHPGSVLYLHTIQYEVHGGLNIKKVADHYGIPDDALRLPDPYAHVQGQYSPKVMNLIYNAADVKLLPSGGEGFGVPVIEAQAAGCPVIVTDATAQTELCGAGWLIPIDPLDGYELSLQYAEWARVLPSQIITALESALAAKDDTALREKARAFGLTYEIGHVWETYAKPAIMAQVNARDTMENERQARTAARRAMRKIKTAELEEDVKYLALNGVLVGELPDPSLNGVKEAEAAS